MFPVFDRGTAPPYDQVLDYTNSPDGVQPVYIGWAAPGTPINAAGWMIRKLSYDGSSRVTNIQYCNGDTGFGQVWNTTPGSVLGSTFSNSGAVFK